MTLDPDPLTPPEMGVCPDCGWPVGDLAGHLAIERSYVQPRRSGCSIFGWLVLLLAIALGTPTPSEALKLSPTVTVLRGAPVDSALAQLAERRINPEVAEAESARGANTAGAPTPTGSVSFLVTATATWCAPTPKQCQSWGGNVKLGAVNSFRDGDEPYLVRVKHGRRQVTVLVVSYCACLGTEHAIDLSPAAFKVLAPLSRGRIDVVLEWPVPELPRTDTDLRMQREVADDNLYR